MDDPAQTIAGGGRCRVQVENTKHSGVLRKAECVVVGGTVGLRQINRLPEIGEDAGLERRRWYNGRVGKSGAKTLKLLVVEEEGLVLDDGTANVETELISNVRIHGASCTAGWIHLRIEPIPRTSETVPTPKPPCVAMKTV